jgi:phosphoenolpyruvate carboxykinase (GTP)
VGIVRRDSMAMKPFCGYNFGDYFAHWLSFDKPEAKLPKIFHVNWFRKGSDGKFLWPGFGDNLRVLEWITERCAGRADAVATPIGNLPTIGAINVEGMKLEPETMTELLRIDREGWRRELEAICGYFDEFGNRLPAALKAEQERIAKALV